MSRVSVVGLGVSAALALGCDSKSPTAPASVLAAPAPARRIVVLGDSLAVSPTMEQSFPSRLQARIDREGLQWRVTNAAVWGDTTASGVTRLDAALSPDAAVLIVALGANDGLRGVDVSVIDRNLSTIVRTAQQRSVRVLLCGMETPPTYGWDYSVAFHFLFPDLAQRLAVPLVPFLLAGVALAPDMNGPDGVHPNAAGAARIAETVWPFLQPLLSVAAATS